MARELLLTDCARRAERGETIRVSDQNHSDDPDKDDVRPDDPAGTRTYVNHCAVTLSLSTAQLDFGQASETDQSVRVKSRIVTSPTYFRQLGDMIRNECLRYDRVHGLDARGEEG